MAVSGIGAVYLFWLGLLVVTESETLYIHVESKGASVFACWFAAVVNK
jgi:threonine/homoserine/homoserine lactone efflux protein